MHRSVKNIAAILIILANFAGYSQGSINTDSLPRVSFQELLDSSKMVFTPPAGYIEIEPVYNAQMNYEKAYKHPTERFEIRYAIRRHEFNFFQQMFEMTALNISGGSLPKYSPFETEAAGKEFNADGGASVMVLAGEEFGMGYKFCLLVYIYKEGVGDAYIFYMADDNTKISEWLMPVFYALKYKE